MRTLGVSDNASIGSLSVSGDSKLLNLEVKGNSNVNSLNVTGNSSLSSLNVNGDTSLTTLGVSDNAFMGSLSVSGDSKLLNLEVKGNSNVNSLNVTGNSSLSSLNVNGDTSLTTLGVSDNAFMGSLNVNNNTLLGNLLVEKADDDVVITNTSLNKDIIFKINNNGSQKEVMRLSGVLKSNKNSSSPIIVSEIEDDIDYIFDAADIIGGFIKRKCNGGDRVDKIDSAANIINELQSAYVNQTIEFMIHNNSLGNFTMILDTYDSNNKYGNLSVAKDEIKKFMIRIIDINNPTIELYGL